MVEVIWTKKATTQLERNIKYLHVERGIRTSELVLNRILQSTKLLESNPFRGRIEPLLGHRKYEYRFVVVWSYKIIYRVTKTQVIISRVFHTSRNPKSLKGI